MPDGGFRLGEPKTQTTDAGAVVLQRMRAYASQILSIVF